MQEKTLQEFAARFNYLLLSYPVKRSLYDKQVSEGLRALRAPFGVKTIHRMYSPP